MNFKEVKLFYVLSCILLCIIILSPISFAVFPLPESERFSELWLLGPNKMIETSPLNVVLSKLYTTSLGVSNHLGGLQYYIVSVTLRNQSQAFQEMGSLLPSSLEPIFEYRLFLKNNETWENDFIFSFEKVSFEENVSRVLTLSLNGNDVNVDKIAAQDKSDGEFYYQLFFELWIYDSKISDFQYHNRSVWFWLNLTNEL